MVPVIACRGSARRMLAVGYCCTDLADVLYRLRADPFDLPLGDPRELVHRLLGRLRSVALHECLQTQLQLRCTAIAIAQRQQSAAIMEEGRNLVCTRWDAREGS